MADQPAVVIGLGNPLMTDDGIGLALLARLQARGPFLPEPLFVDGGTWGMNLLPTIEDAERVLFLDAVNFGAKPGTPIRLERHRLPRWLGLKLSPHQIDLKEVLALAELRGRLPAEAVVVGIQPDCIEMGSELSAAAAAGIEAALDLAVGTLERWGTRGAGSCTS
jgi:hydrogenase maturation protease